jgi:hypothetical protein
LTSLKQRDRRGTDISKRDALITRAAHTPRAARQLTPEFVVTVMLVLVYSIWLLSLPAWPSQDGPAHLYYAHVLGALFSHQPTIYARYYTIKHLLPPYALYYYALLGLSKFLPLLFADRLIVCVYLLLFIFGFRFLASAVGPSADRATLLLVLVSLNWSVGIGFLNYCLSLALALWAIGLWVRFTDNHLLPRFAFLLLVIAITLTHPVPLLIVLAFCGIDLLQRFTLSWRASNTASRAPAVPDLVLFCLSLLALLYVKHFATAHPLSEAQPHPASFVIRAAHAALLIAQLHSISLIFGHSIPILIYRFGQLLTLVIAFALAFSQRLRNRNAGIWTHGDTWLVFSIALLIVLPLLPSNVSGAYYFTERLTILLWIAPLIAASGWAPSASSTGVKEDSPFSSVIASWIPGLILFFAIVTNLCLIWEANALLRPVADLIQASERAPISHTGKLALLLYDSRPGNTGKAGPSWDPFYWAGAHILRHNDAILDNSPWLDSAIIPLGARPELPVGANATGQSASPDQLSAQLLRHPAERGKVLSSADVVLITQPGRPAPSELDPVLAPSPDSTNSWSCHLAASWYQLCLPSAARP